VKGIRGELEEKNESLIKELEKLRQDKKELKQMQKKHSDSMKQAVAEAHAQQQQVIESLERQVESLCQNLQKLEIELAASVKRVQDLEGDLR
jgi:HSP90 family molecular chaperone